MGYVQSSARREKAPKSILVNVARLISAYYTNQPDPSEPDQQVSFGTSGHRGSSFQNSFNENHILAITQSICCYRKENGITDPCIWALTPMPCLNRHSFRRLKCWQPTASKR